VGNSRFHRLAAGLISRLVVALGICLLVGRWIKGVLGNWITLAAILRIGTGFLLAAYLVAGLAGFLD
jgi:hypothetical protein